MRGIRGQPLKPSGRAEVAKHRVATFAREVGRRLAVLNGSLMVAPHEFVTVRGGRPKTRRIVVRGGLAGRRDHPDRAERSRQVPGAGLEPAMPLRAHGF